MKTEIQESEYNSEFEAFLQIPSPPAITPIPERLSSQVSKDLNPSAWSIFGKNLAVHLVNGIGSLSICDQFGMTPFETGFSLSNYFMKFGHSFCMSLCGFLYLGLTFWLVRLILSRDELRVLRRSIPIQVFSLTLLSLVAFIGFGAQMTVAIALLWILGATLGGLLPILLLPKTFANPHTARP